jgi:allantoate deiminase
MARCDALAVYTEELGRITRRFATPPMREVNGVVAGWMRAAGMTTRVDAIGNLIGRYNTDRPDAPTLLLGSHLDSVRDAGRYDGILGVLAALAFVDRLHARGERLPFAVEVLGFADEEGLRYHSAYLGSSVFADTFDREALSFTDPDGISMVDAIRAFGGDPEALAASAWRGQAVAYCEVHIEQGPVLEAQGVPVGVVSGIQGQSRIDVRVTGQAGHAGTVPMAMRHDALCAASELVLVAETLARGTDDLVATAGQLSLYPGASNVIPGEVTLSLDVRHPDDHVREGTCTQIEARARTIAQARGVACDWRELQAHASVPCDAHLRELLARAIEEQGYPVLSIASGAGHDAVILSSLAPIAMLFVRCAGGVSHNPTEAVTEGDVAVALDVLERFVTLLAQERSAP